jgi:uncharacterized membrane protein
MKSRLHWLNLATALCVAAIGALAVWTAVAGPSGAVPVHFDWQGRPDRWGDRAEVAGLLAVLAVVAALAGGGCGLYAGRAADRSRRIGLRAAQAVVLLATAFPAVLSMLSLTGGLHAAPLSPMRLHVGAIALLMLLIGLVLGRVGPNPVAGVRTPWAYKSRLAWDRSNRLAGRLLALIGLAGLIATPLAPPEWTFTALTVAVLVAAVWSAAESWRVWRTDPDRQPF